MKELLPNMNIETLIRLCKLYGLKGYSNLRKEGIVNLILDNLKKSQFSETLEYIIPDNGTSALIFKEFLENKNVIKYDDLRNAVLKKRSPTTFRDVYRNLKAKNIIIEDEKSDDGLHYLPNEFTDVAKKIVNKRISEEIELEEELIQTEIHKESEKKEIKSIEDLLYSKKYSSVSSFRDELIANNLKISGNKAELIDRLLYESGEKIEALLNNLFSKVELKEMSRDFNLKISGTKEELVESLIKNLPLKQPNRLKNMEIITDKEPMIASGLAKHPSKVSTDAEIKSQTTRKIIEEKVDYVNEVIQFLDFIQIDIDHIHNNKDLTSNITTSLQFIKHLKPDFKDAEIKKLDPSREEPVILIDIGDKHITILPWFFGSPSKDQKMRFIYSILTYRRRYSRDFITYIYDPEGKLSEEDDLNMFNELCPVINKIERNFK